MIHENNLYVMGHDVQMKRCLWLRVAVGMLVVAGIFACDRRTERSFDDRRHHQPMSENAQILKIGVTPTLDCLPVYIAEELQFFDTLGLDVRLYPFNAQMDIDTALVGGSIGGAFTDLVRAERMKRKGVPIDVFSATNQHWQLITNKTARLKKLNQLGDKMVAITRFSATDLLTSHVLHGAKTTAPVYRVQINDVSLRLQMLLNNEMDALWLPEPQATTARQAGNTVLFNTDIEDIRLGAIVFRKDNRQKGPTNDQKAIFTRAYNRACDSLNANGIQHYSELVTRFFGIDEETMKNIPKMEFLHICNLRQKDQDIVSKYLEK